MIIWQKNVFKIEVFLEKWMVLILYELLTVPLARVAKPKWRVMGFKETITTFYLVLHVLYSFQEKRQKNLVPKSVKVFAISRL